MRYTTKRVSGIGFTAIFGVWLLLNGLHGEAVARIWTSDSGQHRVDAEMVEQQGDEVLLRKTDGKVIRVAVSQLSESDRDFLQAQSVDRGSSALGAGRFQIRTYRALATAADQCKTAKEAVALYRRFVADPTIALDQRETAKSLLPSWEERARKSQIRFGGAWIDPKEAEDRKKRSEAMVVEGLRLIEVGQGDLARQTLEEASKLDPSGSVPDFILGLGHALLRRDAATAKKHFAECLRRNPKHVSAMNNLALAHIRLKEYSAAISQLEAAQDLTPGTPEIVQNIGRFIHLASKASLRVPSTVVNRANALNSKLLASGDQPPFDPTCGWLYMLHSEAPAGLHSQQDLGANTTTAKPNLIKIGTGSGFVVHPHYILTNRHVAEDSAGLLVVSPEDGKELRASLVALPDERELDLALLRCDDIDTPPAVFARGLRAARGTEIMTLGFPHIRGAAQTLKSTRGTISGVPILDGTQPLDIYYVLDAIANPGNSGGPVADKTGRVLGILSAVTVAQEQNYSLAIPHEIAVPFIAKNVPDFQVPATRGPSLEWTDVDRIVSKSTVLIHILAGRQDAFLPRASRETKSATRPFEDPWCILCYGRGTAKCPNTACARGTVPGGMRSNIVGRNPSSGDVMIQSVPSRARCPTCSGKGMISCPGCRDGIDKNLLRSVSTGLRQLRNEIGVAR